MPTPAKLPPSIEPPKVGDHPALDLLNTVFLLNGTIVDSLQTDQDVLQWLAGAGWPVEHDRAGSKPGALLRSARTLREAIRRIVEARKAGKRTDPAPINALLAQSQSHLKLSSTKGGTLHLERQWRQRTPEEILAPIAEAAAELLATGDFNLVRHCEAPECVLWFYDRTRSHHRRWCSMATCGNRNKVAAFRHRHQATT
ncbi:CGNR zinc finger domain-containing protein [Tunturibacter empetritectus]|uniref:RNA-binding Zn ribbon-like protein n=1 Tax=Tunturiibacter lichenicola TaxID=2051959 RepID=A0A7W8J9M3_9BACT|nr:ABATE domain-containing protein [Edaphobacter lichenicola]MBB5345217.1 putative RNA-binding Zn ribbon-like protein [Edaphobacter lichenicola]